VAARQEPSFMPIAMYYPFVHSIYFWLFSLVETGHSESRRRKKERERETRSEVLESTYGTLPAAAVNAFYLSGQQREMLRSLFPLIHNSDLRNFSDGHKNYGTSMRRLRFCSSYCIIHE
jgi:hypothetical protein